MIRYLCPSCREQGQSPDESAGQVVACSRCGQQLRVPANSKPKAEVPPLPPGGVSTAPLLQSAAQTDASSPAPDLPIEEPVDDTTRANDLSRLRKPSQGRERGESIAEELPDDLPEEVYQMGQPITVFKPHVWRQGFGIVFGFVMIGGGAAAIIIGIILALAHRAGFRPGYLLWVPVGGLLVFLGTLLVVHTLRNLTLRVAIFPDGLVRIRHRAVDIYYWDEIEKVYQQVTNHYYNGVYTGTSYVYRVHRNDGQKVVFNDQVKNVQNLGDLIQQEVMRCLLPRAFARYQEGKPVTFGKITVEQEGLTYNNAFLPWREVQSVKLAQGMLVVNQEGKWLSWCKVSVASIPNLFVLLALIDNIVGVER
jgi:hypothetical protein